MNRLRPALRLGALTVWLAAVAVVSAGLVFADRRDKWRQDPADDGEASAASQPAAMTLVGHEVLGIERKTYPPGHTEAWDQDIGLHAVSVIAGRPVHSGGATSVPMVLARATWPAGPRTRP